MAVTKLKNFRQLGSSGRFLEMLVGVYSCYFRNRVQCINHVFCALLLKPYVLFSFDVVIDANPWSVRLPLFKVGNCTIYFLN